MHVTKAFYLAFKYAYINKVFYTQKTVQTLVNSTKVVNKDYWSMFYKAKCIIVVSLLIY